MSRVLRSGGGGSGSFVQEFKTQSEERWKESTGKLNDEIRELKRKLGSSEGEVERLRQEVERSRGELERERKKGAGEVRRLQTLLDERSSKF
jgi:septal ring factor EnvC (AmiA/AmiB activator)